ncbi:Por secretion system C-terminal sorting domain-containing protein, partial [Reichenbachiella agariperforans]
TPTSTNLGGLGLLTLNLGLELYQNENTIKGFSVGYSSKNLYKLSFQKDCRLFSHDQTPTDISYETEGTYNITLYAQNEEGTVNSSTQSITVSSSTAPNIDFTVDDSRCIDNTNTFTAIDDGDIASYSWDFNEDGVEDSNIANPSYQYPAAGNYQTKLTVTNGSCSNQVTETISMYPVPPSPSFEVVEDLPYCSFSELNLDNTTDESNHVGAAISYSWDYGDGSAMENSVDGRHNYAVADDYSISLTMSIPGCATTANQTVSVIAGPQPDFVIDNDCFGDQTAFTNLSIGDDLVNPLWNFGDGLGSSNLSDPSYEYGATGDYDVTLSMDNSAGCSNDITRTIRINGLPEVAFMNTPGCAETAIQFTDDSGSGDALNNLQAWHWDFNGLGESGDQNPNFTFDETGNYQVSLTVTNTGNCSNEATQTVIVKPVPTVDFAIDLGCIETASMFTDQSISIDENEIASWYWVIDENEYFTKNVTETFDNAGTYTATLAITPTNLCVTSISKEFTVFNLPTVQFQESNNCDNAATVFTDISTTEGPAIVSRTWDFDGEATANGSQASYFFGEADNYDVNLSVTDDLGCINTAGRTVTVHESPISAFEVSDEFGGSPLTVDFTNDSQDGNSFFWDFGVEGASSTTENPSYTYEENGDYVAELITYNDFCSDSSFIEILVATPELDLQLNRIEARERNGLITLWLTVYNNSSFNLDGFDIKVDLESQNSIYEAYNDRLRKGEQTEFPLNFTLSATDNNINFVCVTLQDRETELTDENLPNNQGCINFEQEIVIPQPFPNPVPSGNNALYVQTIVPSKSPVEISLLDATGHTLYHETFVEINSGLNTFELNTENYRPGMYFVRIIYAGQDYTQKVIKQ